MTSNTTLPAPAAAAPPNERERLRQHFLQPAQEHGDLWDALWQQGDFLPWDKGEAGPALADALTHHSHLFGGAAASTKAASRKRALVPGCGRGHDVLFLASVGYDAYGLEISGAAVRACYESAEKEFAKYTSAAAAQEEEGAGGKSAGPGAYRFVQGDFFADEWVGEMGAREGFDLIYDYTFFCALPHELRPAWALRHSQLLATDGRLVCLEFPTYKAPSTGGPPFGLTPDTYVAHLTHPGEKLPYNEEGYPEESTYGGETKPGDAALERIAHWKAERTFKIGQGTDHVGVWRHRPV